MYVPRPGGIVPPMVSSFAGFLGVEHWERLYNLPVGSTPFGWGSNTVAYQPVILPGPCVARRVWWANGSSTSGNVSVALYRPTASGEPGSKVIECGSTSAGTASQVVFVDITDTYLTAGLLWLALASSASTNFMGALQGTAALDAFKVFSEGSITVGSLPSTATPVEASSSRLLLFGFATTASP